MAAACCGRECQDGGSSARRCSRSNALPHPNLRRNIEVHTTVESGWSRRCSRHRCAVARICCARARTAGVLHTRPRGARQQDKGDARPDRHPALCTQPGDVMMNSTPDRGRWRCRSGVARRACRAQSFEKPTFLYAVRRQLRRHSRRGWPTCQWQHIRQECGDRRTRPAPAGHRAGNAEGIGQRRFGAGASPFPASR